MRPKPVHLDAGVELYRGDVLEVLPKLPDGYVDAVITSPPYLEARPDYAAFAAHDYGELFDELKRVCHGPMLFNVGRLWRDNVELLWWLDIIEAAALAGVPHADTIVWAKLNGNPIQGAVLANAHEYVLAFGDPADFDTDAVRTEYAAGSVERLRRRWVASISVKGDGAFRNGPRREAKRGERRQANELGARGSSVVVVETGRHKGNPHPAPMPLHLAEYLVRLSGGRRILDPFAGSGTTALAARAHGRASVLIELDADYCSLITERLSLELEVIEHGRAVQLRLEGDS